MYMHTLIKKRIKKGPSKIILISIHIYSRSREGQDTGSQKPSELHK